MRPETLLPYYLVTGDEILLVEEHVALILKKAQASGYTEHIIVDADLPQAIDLFRSHWQNLSLFTLKKIIELRFRQKINGPFVALLTEIFDQPDPNQIILIRTPKLSRAETQATWYKMLEKKGSIITVWPLKNDSFLQWIKRRFQAKGLSTSEEAYAYIAANTEGNLLAAAQTIEKLHLAHVYLPTLNKEADKQSESGDFIGITQQSVFISIDEIKLALADHTHYDVFEICDAFLSQNALRSLRILNTLKAQNAEPAVILWALMQDVRKLAALQAIPTHQYATFYKKQGIWSTRQVLFQKALSTLTTPCINALVQKAKEADAQIKGITPGNIWSTLEDFCLISLIIPK